MKAALLAPLLLASCAPPEPPNWARGGAPLVLGPATWERTDETVELRANGEVVSDGDLVLVIDRVGRVVNEDYDPVAIVLPSGEIRGTHNQSLGRVGVTNAAPPWSAFAWLTVDAAGNVTRYQPDGARVPEGRFSGCYGPVLPTCTLVAHLLTLRHTRLVPVAPIHFGVGFGVGL